MAKQTLQTNFVDDILEESMSGKRRYNLIQNDDGTVSLEDVTNYSQIGSSFGAAQVNAMNNAINESADKSKIIDNLSDIAANQQSGMMAGALAVRELNNKMDTGLDKKASNYHGGSSTESTQKTLNLLVSNPGNYGTLSFFLRYGSWVYIVAANTDIIESGSGINYAAILEPSGSSPITKITGTLELDRQKIRIKISVTVSSSFDVTAFSERSQITGHSWSES